MAMTTNNSINVKPLVGRRAGCPGRNGGRQGTGRGHAERDGGPGLDDLGLRPKLRHHADGSVYLTDENNYILDCAGGMISEPEETAAEIRGIVGVVEHGLFLGMASLVLVAGEDGVTELVG